jgi:hypothetical protein
LLRYAQAEVIVLRATSVWGALALALLTPTAGSACNCGGTPTPSEAAKEADAIFVGTVVGTQTQPDWSSGIRVTEVRVSFLVRSAWKGTPPLRATVVTPANEAACGYSFRTGERYLVYASRHQGELHSGLCTRNARVAEAGEDLAALGPPPLNVAAMSLIVMLTAAGAALIGVGWRKRRAEMRL